MRNRHGDPDELRDIAARLEEERPQLDPLALDRVKLRARSRSRRIRPGAVRASLLRSQAMLMSTVALLILGSGTAIAVCGGGGGPNPGGEGKNSGYGQYKNGCPPGWVQVGDTECCEEISKGGKGNSYGLIDTDGKSTGGSGSCCPGEKSNTYGPLDKDSGGSTSSCCPDEKSNTYGPLDKDSGGSTSSCCPDQNTSTYGPLDKDSGGDSSSCCPDQSSDPYGPLDKTSGGGTTQCCTSSTTYGTLDGKDDKPPSGKEICTPEKGKGSSW